MKNTLISKIRRKINDVFPKKTVVLGVGNILLSDEGVGIHVAKKLQHMRLPSEIEIVEGETNGFGLLDLITEADRLIIIDSVKIGNLPGSIYKFYLNDTLNSLYSFKTSFHQIGILEIIKLSRLVGKSPETTVIGIEPKNIKVGVDLSPEVQAKIPRIIELILREINNQS